MRSVDDICAIPMDFNPLISVRLDATQPSFKPSQLTMTSLRYRARRATGFKPSQLTTAPASKSQAL